MMSILVGCRLHSSKFQPRRPPFQHGSSSCSLPPSLLFSNDPFSRRPCLVSSSGPTAAASTIMFDCRLYSSSSGKDPLLSTCHSQDNECDNDENDENDALLLRTPWPTSPLRSRRSSAMLHALAGGIDHHASSPNNDNRSYGGTWSVGKLSILLLALATIVDFALCHVQSMESPEFYDALSADVIRPAFRYHTSSSSSSMRPRTSLGSAAISSVTEALSPILPFTGGLDLRKQDYWKTSGNFFETLQSVATQVQEAFSSRSSADATITAIPRGGGNVPGKLTSTLTGSKRKPTQHVSAISASEPFVSLSTISELTLSEVAETFRYALECNKETFNEGRFQQSVSPRVRKVVTAISDAMAKSRGKDVKLSLLSSSSSSSSSSSYEPGQVDALAFSAAMRIFAEWRLLRQVPEGYKGFAVGMSLGHKDVVQNLAKIEQGAHDWLNRQRDFLALQAQWEANGAEENCPIDGTLPRELRSPTLKDVLNYEIEMDINPSSRLPRLKDKSASMGVLWVRRQLHYQTLLFDNVLKIPSKFASTPDAVMAAYQSVYDKYHGWAVQKIFNYSFQSAPDATIIYKHMNPHKLQDVLTTALKSHGSSKAAASSSSQGLLRKEESIGDDENPFVSFFKHVGGEWDKLVYSVAQVFGHDNDKPQELLVRGGSGSGSASSPILLQQLQDNAVDALVTREMTKDAHEHISSYLKVVYPLLEDLAKLFDQMNMDDPTRV